MSVDNKAKRSIDPEEEPAAKKAKEAKLILDQCKQFQPFRSDNRVSRDFFDVECTKLARNLLGQYLVRRLPDGTVLKCKICETEAYLGGDDKASHSFNGKRTERNEPMFMEPGTAYVYLTYGVYFSFNVSSKGDGAAVLIRAGVPIDGIEYMRAFRGKKRKDLGQKLKHFEVLNGPSKLSMAMAIEKDNLNKEFLPASESLWIEHSGSTVKAEEIVVTKRVGIENVGKDWSGMPLRFYIKADCRYVSARDRDAEQRPRHLA